MPAFDPQQVGLAIANLPSFARRLNAASHALDAKAARVGESHPTVQQARISIGNAAAKLQQLDNAVRAAYARAVNSGAVREPNPPTARFDTAAPGDRLSGVGTVITSIIALSFAVAAVVALVFAAPLVAGLLALGAVIAGITALVSSIEDGGVVATTAAGGTAVLLAASVILLLMMKGR